MISIISHIAALKASLTGGVEERKPNDEFERLGLTGPGAAGKLEEDAAGISASDGMKARYRGIDAAMQDVQEGLKWCEARNSGFNREYERVLQARHLAVKATGENDFSFRELVRLDGELKSIIGEITAPAAKAPAASGETNKVVPISEEYLRASALNPQGAASSSGEAGAVIYPFESPSASQSAKTSGGSSGGANGAGTGWSGLFHLGPDSSDWVDEMFTALDQKYDYSGLDIRSVSGARAAIVKLDSSIEFLGAAKKLVGALAEKLTEALDKQLREYLNVRSSESRIEDAGAAAATAELAKEQIKSNYYPEVLFGSTELPASVLEMIEANRAAAKNVAADVALVAAAGGA